MKAVVAAFNQEKALVGAFSVITNLRMELLQALVLMLHLLYIVMRKPPPSPMLWLLYTPLHTSAATAASTAVPPSPSSCAATPAHGAPSEATAARGKVADRGAAAGRGGTWGWGKFAMSSFLFFVLSYLLRV